MRKPASREKSANWWTWERNERHSSYTSRSIYKQYGVSQMQLEQRHSQNHVHSNAPDRLPNFSLHQKGTETISVQSHCRGILKIPLLEGSCPVFLGWEEKSWFVLTDHLSKVPCCSIIYYYVGLFIVILKNKRILTQICPAAKVYLIVM